MKVSRPEIAGVLLATMLCGLAMVAQAQTAASPPPPTAIAVDGKPPPAPPPKVLADPDTKLYARCRQADDQLAAPEGSAAKTVRPPKAQLMTEEAAKARGYRPSAHKVSCD